MTYETRTTKVAVLPKGESLYHEGATHIEIIDRAAGEFIEVSQENDDAGGNIKIDIYEWPFIRAAIDKMIKDCRGDE